MKRTTNVFKWRHFEPEIILLCVRWYCRYQLSYRDLAEMMNERGLEVHHSTLFRWVQDYAPEINKRIRPHLKRSERDLTKHGVRFKPCMSDETHTSLSASGSAARQRLSLAGAHLHKQSGVGLVALYIECLSGQI